jgi:hypothetical protein
MPYHCPSMRGRSFLPLRRMWLPSQRWIVATLRGKFTGKLMTDTTNDKKLGHFVGHSRPKRNAIVEGMGILRRSFYAILVAMHESRLAFSSMARNTGSSSPRGRHYQYFFALSLPINVERALIMTRARRRSGSLSAISIISSYKRWIWAERAFAYNRANSGYLASH